MNTKRLAFTLVEVLIVVVIMAVLAAVVVPQFADSTTDAKKSTGEFNLSTLRSTLQTFKAQHNGASPTIDGTTKSLLGLLKKTDATGAVSATGAYGPYILEMPPNPFTNVATVKATTNVPPTSSDVTASNAGGYLYDAATGQLWLDSNTAGEFAW